MSVSKTFSPWFKTLVIAAVLLALGFVAGTSLRGMAMARNPTTVESTKNRSENPTESAERSENGQITVLFTPQDNIQKTLANTIAHAQRSVWVQAYLFTDERIADALVAAHRRGVDVEVLMDAKQATGANNKVLLKLVEAGIAVRLETIYETAHNKIMIIDAGSDRALVATGSYNYTYGAQARNAENVLIIRRAPATIQRYIEHWHKHAEQATAYGDNPVS